MSTNEKASNTTLIPVGQRVRYGEHPEWVGTVRYAGPIKGQISLYYGIEWDIPVGKYDGSYEGVPYFSCESLHGSFVHPKRLHPAVSLAETVLDRYVTGREEKGLESMYVYGEGQKTQVNFYGQRKLDMRHKQLETLTEVDLQGYNIGYLGTPDELRILSKLESLRFLEISFTLLNNPIDVLTLFCVIPSLEVVLVNGCNVRWDELFEAGVDSGESSKAGLPKKRKEFLQLIQTLQRREKPYSIFTNSTKQVRGYGSRSSWASGLALRALLCLPKLADLSIDYWTLASTDIFEQRHRTLTTMSARYSFGEPLFKTLLTFARAFPSLEGMTLGIDKEENNNSGNNVSNDNQAALTIEEVPPCHCLHIFNSLKLATFSNRHLDVSMLRLLRRICPKLEEIRHGNLYANGVQIPAKEEKAYAVTILPPTLKIANWITLSADTRSSEERFYVSIWRNAALKLSGEALRRFWSQSPEVLAIIQKHKLQLPPSELRHLLAHVPEFKEVGEELLSETQAEETKDESSIVKQHNGKLVEIVLSERYGFSKDGSGAAKRILLPKSTCIWRVIAIIREHYSCDISHGMIASGRSMYGESISSLSRYTPIGDVVSHECRIQV